MTRRMTAAPKLIAYHTGCKTELRAELVEDAGFSNTGVSGKRIHFAGNDGSELVQSLPRLRTRSHDLKSGAGINLHQVIRRIQITLVHANNRLTVAELRDCAYTVDQKRVRHGIDRGSKHH